MIRRLLFVALFLLSTHGFSQFTNETYSHNNYQWDQNSVGRLSSISIPGDSNLVSVWLSTMWIGGYSENGELKVTASINNNLDSTFAPGPLKTNDYLDSSAEVLSEFNRNWYITSSQIETHLEYYDCLNNAGCNVEALFPNGYEIPEPFLSWPAMGDEDAGYAPLLAPFVDYNSDGTYNPTEGDYPEICGDFAVFEIYNDVHGSAENPIGAEIHTMVYGFENQNVELDNTLFVKHQIYNRSSHPLSSAYFGIYSDFNMGGPEDDYIGTDVSRSMFYGYNGDDYDGPSGINAYGADLPAMGLRILAGPLSIYNDLDDSSISEEYSTYGNQTIGWGDGEVDNERLGLANTLYFHWSGADTQGNPESPQEYYNYMTGRWKDGQPMTFGHNGAYEGTEASYIYPGDTDPLNLGTNGVDPEFDSDEGWSEVTADNYPSDRRMHGSSGPFTLPAGGMQEIDYAFVFARKSYDPELSEIETMQQYSDEIVEFACVDNSLTNSVEDLEQAQLDVLVYPNPATDQLIVQYDSPEKGEFELFDLTGRSILSGDVADGSRTIELSNLSNGTYILRVKAGERLSTQKVIIQK